MWGLLRVIVVLVATASFVGVTSGNDDRFTTDLWATIVEYDQDSYTLSIFHPESGTHHELASGNGRTYDYFWATDSSWVMYRDNCDNHHHCRVGFVRVGVAGTTDYFENPMGLEQISSPDGLWTAWNWREGDYSTPEPWETVIYTMVQAQPEVRRLDFDLPPSHQVGYPSPMFWSPNSQWIYVADTFHTCNPDCHAFVAAYRMRPDGSDFSQFYVSNQLSEENFRWLSVTQDWVVIGTTKRNNANVGVIYRARPDGTERQQVEMQPTSGLGWITASGAIVTMHSGYRAVEFYRIEPSLETVTPLTATYRSIDRKPTWAADHSFMAMRVQHIDVDNIYILVMREDGEELAVYRYEPCGDELPLYWLENAVYFTGNYEGACTLLRVSPSDAQPTPVYAFPNDTWRTQMIEAPDPAWLMLDTDHGTFLLSLDGQRTAPIYALPDDGEVVAWVRIPDVGGDSRGAMGLGVAMALVAGMGMVWTGRRG